MTSAKSGRSGGRALIRLELDGQTYLQRTLDEGGRAELYALHDGRRACQQ
jgi:hypothetical protein